MPAGTKTQEETSSGGVITGFIFFGLVFLLGPWPVSTFAHIAVAVVAFFLAAVMIAGEIARA